MAITLFLQFVDLPTDFGVSRNALSTVYFLRNGLRLLPQRGGFGVNKLKLVRLFAQSHYCVCQLDCTCATLGPMLGHHHLCAIGSASLFQQTDFGRGVLGAVVDGHHARQAVMVFDVAQVALEVDHAFFQGV